MVIKYSPKMSIKLHDQNSTAWIWSLYVDKIQILWMTIWFKATFEHL